MLKKVIIAVSAAALATLGVAGYAYADTTTTSGHSAAKPDAHKTVEDSDTDSDTDTDSDSSVNDDTVSGEGRDGEDGAGEDGGEGEDGGAGEDGEAESGGPAGGLLSGLGG